MTDHERVSLIIEIILFSIIIDFLINIKCIVQSYIQWLQDNDYNPICILCNKLLSEESTIRLVCYDVFHWSCLNEYALSLPSNTAPAGYQCPKCKECIFPQNKLATPVAEVLRNRLAETTWARIGLGQSLVSHFDTYDFLFLIYHYLRLILELMFLQIQIQ